MNRIVAIGALVTLSMWTHAATDVWVTVDNLNRRTCPEVKCGVVGVLKFREKVSILEKKKGWARISKYYNASCKNGVSQYVDSGNNRCLSKNGIRKGKFAEWVSDKYLSAKRPPDPAATASANYALVKGSDDFRIYKNTFAKAASQLIVSGRCSAGDFREMGGWLKSSNQKSKPVYFTYCGGMRANNKVYLNAATGEILK